MSLQNALIFSGSIYFYSFDKVGRFLFSHCLLKAIIIWYPTLTFTKIRINKFRWKPHSRESLHPGAVIVFIFKNYVVRRITSEVFQTFLSCFSVIKRSVISYCQITTGYLILLFFVIPLSNKLFLRPSKALSISITLLQNYNQWKRFIQKNPVF